MRQDVTLVCGGGGLWGTGWMTGLAFGLFEQGIDLRQAGMFIGTSAGSVVGSQLASGQDLGQLYARQTDPALQPPLLPAPPGSLEAMTKLLHPRHGDDTARLRAVCDLALRTSNLDKPARAAEVAKRLGLPGHG